MSDMSELSPFDIKSFSPDEDQYIEASAGTGKTYTIRKISAELVRNKIPLSEVLFVTYTEKAAGEMRDRIREEMTECLASASAQEKPLFERACQDVDKAVIGTIHSFCRKTLHDFAYEADVPFDLDNADDQAADVIIDRLIRDEWEDDICALEVKKSLPEDVENIKELLKNSLKSYSPNKKPCLPPSTAIEWINENPEAKKHFETLNANQSATFTAINNTANGVKTFAGKSVKALIEAMLSSRATLVSGSKFGSILTSVEAGSPEATEEVTNALNYFFPMKIDLCSDAEKKRLEFLNEKTAKLYKFWQEEKARQKVQSFDDMIMAVREGVCPGGTAPEQPTSLCEKIRDSYKIAVIDEFQDTNEFQWNIFETVFLNSNRNQLIVVGDPKQSIYSFQGADLQVYRQATKSIKKGSALKTNFRSSISMVNACNSMFSVGDDSAYPFLPKGDFSESLFPTDVKNQRQNAIFNGEEIKPIWVSPIVPEKGFARFAVQTIIDCCKVDGEKTALQVFDRGESNPRNVNFSDFVILGRTRPEMEEIKNCLADVGIPFILYKDDSLFDSRECAEWLSVLRLLAAPDLSGYNSTLLNSVFVTDFFGIDLCELTDDPQKKAGEKILSQVTYWKLLASKKQWTELQEQIYEDTGIEQKLSKPNRLQDLMKLRQIGNYIFGYLYEKKASLQQAIKHLETLSEDSQKASTEEKNIVAKGTDFKAVRLMTIHSSKGLEFPVVISCAGFKGVYDQMPGPYVFTKEEKTGDSGESQWVKYYGYDRISKNKRQIEEIREWHRLLYVDYTRASSLLILPQYDRWFECEKDGTAIILETLYNLKIRKLLLDKAAQNDSETDRAILINKYAVIDKTGTWAFLAYAHRKLFENGEFAEIRDWNGSWNIEDLRPAVTAELAFFNKDDKEDLSKLPSQEILDQIRKALKDSSLYQHSYSSIDKKSSGVEITSIDGERHNRSGEEPDDDSSVEVAEDPDYPRGNLFGEALHQVFEELDFARIGSMDIDDAHKDPELCDLITNKFISQGLPIGKHPNWMRRTVEIVWNTMSASLPEIHGIRKTGSTFCLKELDASQRLAEMEFRLKANDKVADSPLKTFCKGFMDLVFVRKDGDKEYYSVLDWKSNLLEKYDSEACFEAVKEHYSIQMVLYSYSLVKWLCCIWDDASPEKVYQENFGGIYYVFARGCQQEKNNGIYAHTWATFAELEAAYREIENMMLAPRKAEVKND